MNPSGIGLVVFGLTFGGALLGMWLRTVLPKNHLDAESRDTVKVGIGLIATMTALVLGLVTASAKSAFDDMDAAVKQAAVKILTLDRTLARYGPETGEIRKVLKDSLGVRIETVWPQGPSRPGDPDPIRSGAASRGEGLAAAIRGLSPHDDNQRAMQARAVDLSEALLQERWSIVAGTEGGLSMAFLVILVSWLTITFTSFGLFAPRNATVLAVLLLCAVSVASAVFLILEMDSPFAGLLKVSADPLRYTFEHLNQ
jgi:hypothetical protein